MKKLLLLLTVLLIGTVGWYGFVSSWFLTFSSDAKLVSKTSPNIFLDSEKLNNIVLVFKSNENIKNHTLHSSCETETEFLDSYQSLVDNILEWRLEKYLLPVPGYNISNNPGDLPNAPRWYRASYTDGIHHWWDAHSPAWADIVTIDDGIIVRIVRGFEYDDLSKITRWTNITEDDKLKNLDILRWNQVWLKTTKWDVIFYSHLDEVSDEIEEGDMIERDTYIGTVWVSGVPEIWYDDYHLHFAIQKNPYDLNKVWSYTFDDYMRWDWSFKWKSASYIIDNKHKVFFY